YQCRRRIDHSRPLDETQRARGITRQRRTGGAIAPMLLDGGFLFAPERAVQIIGQQDFEFGASDSAHSATCRRRMRAKSARPRFNLDFTVPSGISSTCAISR